MISVDLPENNSQLYFYINHWFTRFLAASIHLHYDRSQFLRGVGCLHIIRFLFFGESMKNSRRQFMILSAAGACTLALNGKVQAQAMVAETDPQAKALQYVVVSKDAGKYCNNCALYQGKADSAAGGCSLFAGKQVAAKGHCSAWAKKA